MKIITLSSQAYEDAGTQNYGDCILIDTDTELVIYDCGSIKHAQRVMDYMKNHKYAKAKLILSHNDSDHFNGIPTLLEQEKLSEIHTILLLKYVDDILGRIDDQRKTRESVKKQILDCYDNIAQLSGSPLYDIYENSFSICPGITIIGPNKDYMLDTVAKRLDGREGDTVNGETAVNATSILMSVQLNTKKLLLDGDCSFAAIENFIKDYDTIQLPHHGKIKQANKIFDNTNACSTDYIISDNTGATNGGSDDLNTKGHRVKNTKHDGDIVLGNLSPYSGIALSGLTLGDD